MRRRVSVPRAGAQYTWPAGRVSGRWRAEWTALVPLGEAWAEYEEVWLVRRMADIEPLAAARAALRIPAGRLRLPILFRRSSFLIAKFRN